jgi:hypothetical protein
MNGFDDLLNNTPASYQTQLSKEEYAAKKQGEREAIFELSDNTALEVAGYGDVFRHYLDIQSKFDRYSAVNAMLIMAQSPEATRVGSFDHWKGRGGSVRTGETGISILEPHNYTKEDGSPGVGYDIKKVFDISQIDTRRMTPGKPPPKYDERQILGALISKYPLKITGVDELPEGRFGESTAHLGAMTDHDGSILVRKGMEFSETFRAVAYEMACAEMATDPELSSRQEFNAYSATYLLCKKYGADTQSFSFENAPDMFNGMDAQEVKGELSQIRDAAAAIGERMAKQLDKPPRSGDAR